MTTPMVSAPSERAMLATTGRAAGAGAAALAGGHEDHVGALEDLLDLVAVVLGRLPADLGGRAGAEAAGELAADVELDVGVAHQQRLGVGVDGDELDALEADLDHAVDGVDATTADADHLDDGEVVLRCCHGVGAFRSAAERVGRAGGCVRVVRAARDGARRGEAPRAAGEGRGSGGPSPSGRPLRVMSTW